MPPVAKAGGSEFRKDVAFVTKDEDEQLAAGIVMVPDKADLQHDFAREDTIRSFADQFETFVEAGEAGGGIMHAVFPDDWMALERNMVLDEAEEIGGETVEAGAWIQEWRIDNTDLWSLIDDGVLEGYSLGAIDVRWDGPYEQADDEVDDVAVPDELGEDALVWELTDGIIREVSAVDIPAVPDAEILETKADAEKRLAEHLGNQQAFIDEALERGHTEAEAEQLWDVLNEAIEVEGAQEPGKQSAFHRAGRAFISALTGSESKSGSGSESDDGAGDQSSPEAPDRSATKEGRTLSAANRESVMASIDAGLDVLADAGVDDLPKRFTDREDVDFDLGEHDAREWVGDHGEDEGEDSGSEDEDGDMDASTTNNAAGGDTPDDKSSTDAADDMPDDTNPDDDPGEDKSLAEKNAEQIEDYGDRLDELTSTVNDIADAVADDGEEKTVEVETPDGETYVVSESEAKSWFDEDDAGSDDPFADAPEWAKALRQDLKEDIEANTARIDRMNQQSGHSQQLDRAAGSDDAEKDKPLDSLGQALN